MEHQKIWVLLNETEDSKFLTRKWNIAIKQDDARNEIMYNTEVLIIKDVAYVINFDGNKRKGTRWVSLFIGKNTAMYFDSFRIEYIRQGVLGLIKGKSIMHNIFRIQDDDYVMCGFYCIAFIEFMVAGKTLGYTNLFSPNDYKKNDKIIYKYFKGKYDKP